MERSIELKKTKEKHLERGRKVEKWVRGNPVENGD